MNKGNRKTKLYNSVEIIENAVITYKDGYIDLFNAIYVTETEIVFGRISDKNSFIKCGGIPTDNIKKIECSNKRKVYVSRKKI